MADGGIKKAKVLQADLPTMNSETNTYSIRYRIVSEDRNRVSHWSPIIAIDPGYTYVPGNIVISKTSSYVNIIWDPVTIMKGTSTIRQAKDYDVWIKFGKSDLGDWKYSERISGNSTSFLIPEDYTVNGVAQGEKPNQLTVEIFLKGNPISRVTRDLLVYNPAVETV